MGIMERGEGGEGYKNEWICAKQHFKCISCELLIILSQSSLWSVGTEEVAVRCLVQ